MAGMDRVLSLDHRRRYWPHLRRWLLVGVAATVAAVVGIALVRSKEVVVLPPAGNCRLDKTPCRATLTDGSILTLDLGPRPINPKAPLNVAVGIAGSAPTQIEASLRGVTMNMGVHEIALTQTSEGKFRATGSLPVCTSGRMAWEVTLRVTSGRLVYLLPFEFESGG